MVLDNRGNEAIEDCLRDLGISSLDTWDILVFLYRHRTSLASADHIARLLGYPAPVTGQALDTLESLGLIRRSRDARGVRLFQLACSAAVLERLAEHRAGRVLVGKTLPAKNSTLKGAWNGGEPSQCA
jgi:DNA-binding MarR family transcriptional regulator